MDSAYNQMPLGEQSRCLTQFVIGNQQYEFSRLFYGKSMRSVAFYAFMTKILRPHILNCNFITNLYVVFIQSQTKQKVCKLLDKFHQVLLKETKKAVPYKSLLFSPE